MKKGDIIELIKAHYDEDGRLFFQITIEILKEFKKNGDDELVKLVSDMLKSRVKIAPKRRERPVDYNPEIAFEDATCLDWVPMMEPQETANE